MLPPFITRKLSEWLDIEVSEVLPLSGGMIAQAARVETKNGSYFVKWNANAPDHLYSEEGYGLWLIAHTKTIRTPRILAVCDRTPDLPQEEIPYTFLVLEYIENTEPQNPTSFTERFAMQLAALHSFPTNVTQYGLKNDNFLGLSPQKNTPRTTSWAEFFRDSRLLPQIEQAKAKGLLPTKREHLLRTVLEKTPSLLADIPPEISIVHGDLWAGNFLCGAGDIPVLIDPAAYYGHREMEMVYVELFGGFPPNFMALYDAVLPLDSGYRRRRPLHQLYHLLNHLNHFGEEYGPSVERACHATLASV